MIFVQNIEEGLSLAAQAFLEGDDALQIDATRKEVKLSKIFSWYRVDFGRNDEEVWNPEHSEVGVAVVCEFTGHGTQEMSVRKRKLTKVENLL